MQVGNLKYLKGKTDLPLVQLLGDGPGYVTADTGTSYEEMTSDEGLDDIATYATGVGPWKNTIVPVNEDTRLLEETIPLVARLHERGIQVCHYKYRSSTNCWNRCDVFVRCACCIC